MLRIRDEQLQALRAPLIDALAARVDGLLCRHFGNAAALPPEALRARTRSAIERAMSFGLETDRDLALYATAAWIFGAELDALVQRDGDFLRSASLDRAAKAARLRAILERDGDLP